jgi:hypothetical protein
MARANRYEEGLNQVDSGRALQRALKRSGVEAVPPRSTPIPVLVRTCTQMIKYGRTTNFKYF